MTATRILTKEILTRGRDCAWRRPSEKSAALERMPSVAKGTANMIKCAAVTRTDRVVIITDRETLKVGKGIERAAASVGATVEFIMMEELGERPLTELPPKTAEKVRALNPTVSFLAATAKPGELGFRKPLMNMLVDEFKVRHVHMPTITQEIAVGQAMCADYAEVYRVTHAVMDAVKNARAIKVITPLGTDITAKFDHAHTELNWYACDGKIQKQGMVSNLPDGEVFTTPLTVNGTFVTTVLGDYFAAKYGVLETPVTIEIKNGKAISVSCKNRALRKELWAYLNNGKNTNRVGEFAIGTNVAVTRLIGNVLADEKAAGIHIAFGDPLGEETGAKWKVNPIQHCDMITQGCTIVVDGRTIMENGKFLI